MSAHQTLRTGNKALSYLVDNYPQDTKLQTVVDLFPRFAGEMYATARDAAHTLLRKHTPNPLIRIAKRIATSVTGSGAKETALANCILDLQLTVCFSEFSKYFGDSDIASVLVDAFLYQATGFEADSPTEEQLLFAGTHNTRGIHKFQIAWKSMPHIGDSEAWIFGKEFSAIASGNSKDIACIVSVSPFSLVARVRARWLIRYLLYGTPPTKEDEQALEVDIKKQEKSLKEMLNGFLNMKDANKAL